MSVKLAFALANNDQLVHISDSLSRSVIYCCPFCKEEVTYRKGSQKEHHFSHKPNSDCVASEETVLHYNAKHYLARLINTKKDLTISIPIKMFKKPIQSLFRSMNIPNYELSLSQFIRFYKGEFAYVEKAIGTYIADILVSTKNTPVIFEIFVTHLSEPDKIKFLEDNDLPYLELSPIESGSEIRFEFVKGSLDSFVSHIESEIKETTIKLLYPELKNDLLKEASEKLKEDKVHKFQLEAVQKLANQANSIGFSFNQYKMEETNSVVAAAYNTIVKRSEPLQSISYKNSSNGKKYLMANHTYFISSEQNLLYSIISQLSRYYSVECLIGGWADSKNESVIGFKFCLPNKDAIRTEVSKYLTAIIANMVDDVEDIENDNMTPEQRLDIAEKKYSVQRGFAVHIDDCPKNVRNYNGKAYANLIDDCSSCPHLLARSENLGAYDFPEQFIVCGGRKNIVREDEVITISFNREEYRNSLLKQERNHNETVYECSNCGSIGICSVTEEECDLCGEIVQFLS